MRILVVDDDRAVRASLRRSLKFNRPRGASGPRAIRTHALVQRATLEHQPPEVISAAVTAADALVQVWPEVERDTELGRALRDNTARLTDRDPHLLWEPDGHPVLGRAGRSLGECGLVRAAVSHRAAPLTPVLRHGHSAER